MLVIIILIVIFCIILLHCNYPEMFTQKMYYGDQNLKFVNDPSSLEFRYISTDNNTISVPDRSGYTRYPH